MSWEPFSLHFKLVYDGCYRYLDRCGELMMRAEDLLNLMPEDVNPNGCKMSLPESGISVGLGTTEMAVTQELYADGGAEFLKVCQLMADLSLELFEPRNVDSKGLAAKSIWRTGSFQAALAMSLKMGKGFSAELARDVDMPAQQESIDCHFAAGSKDLHFKIHPVTFQSVTLQKFNAPPLSTATHRRRLDRLNKRAERLDTSLQQGVMMELDLIEFDPPATPIENYYEQLKKKEQMLQSRFTAS
jgi:hypothetical protein